MSDNFMSMVLMSSPAFPAAPTIMSGLRQLLKAEDVSLESSAAEGPHIVSIGSDRFAIMTITAPVPAGTLTQAVQNSLTMPGAQSLIASHVAHMIVSQLSTCRDLDHRISCAKSMTAITSVLATAGPTVAIYWVQSDALYDGRLWSQSTNQLQQGRLPVEFWVRLHLFKGSQVRGGVQVGCFTTGLSAFTGFEIEFELVLLPPATIADRVLGLIQHQLDHGSLLEDGDTVGVSDDERITVTRHQQGRRVGRPIVRLNAGANAVGATSV